MSDSSTSSTSNTSPVTVAIVSAVLSSAATATVMSPPSILKQMTSAYSSTPNVVVPSSVLLQEMATHRDYSGEHGILPDAGRP